MLLLQFTSNSIPILCFLLLLSIVTTASESKPPSSVYDVLRAHGLPMGLLPKGVTKFEIDEGRPVPGPPGSGLQCQIRKRIALRQERLGHSQLRPDRSLVGSGIIYFDVGVVFKQFSLSLFETPPECTASTADDQADVDGGRLIVDAVSKKLETEIKNDRLMCRVNREKLRYWLDQEQHFGRGFE
ncbi:hypothetical protein M0R45_010130 [Rubus argutus]|uniref:Uncharacterized protein n=1 Tax=Rubus argutus TaxID=59490 RepID=A0AAW1Y6I2_RUBAR